MKNFVLAVAALYCIFAAKVASAGILTYDDIGVPGYVFPNYTQTGFVEQGFQFSNNMDVVDISATSPLWSDAGPAVSGDFAALNDWGGPGVITQVGGGAFSFEGSYIKSWANVNISGSIDGYLNNVLVGSVNFSVNGWANVLANFAAVDKVVINTSDLFLLDDTVASPLSPVPEPSSLVLLGLGGIGVGLAAWRRRRVAA